ncbi:hypothetical protein [Synechococcus sp. HBA1120]|uniref:hypothetical protein n=1 Tax=Synechococcus sp. HBA1120 TaxID=2508341 RepID=UPI001CF8001C|nr:hypothetical protein [Synechococcus sp. HBA1120]
MGHRDGAFPILVALCDSALEVADAFVHPIGSQPDSSLGSQRPRVSQQRCLLALSLV